MHETFSTFQVYNIIQGLRGVHPTGEMKQTREIFIANVCSVSLHLIPPLITFQA